MPMIQLTLPENTFTNEQVNDLALRLTKIVMWWVGVPDTPRGRPVAWLLVSEHPVKRVYAGGVPADKPRYLLEVRAMTGGLDVRATSGIIRDATKVILAAEGSPDDADNGARVYIIFREVEVGEWGIAGAVYQRGGYVTSLDDIQVSTPISDGQDQ
jgi:phenylpyruvate tautomerase PptA (4-oxalocrotonate tautomerase family)